ncbi:MAG: hypothetical protein LBV08_06665 [Clostridiales bacterium]|jgi:flagellar basal body-associated protein FliL|nr:hypothetical protein [Clostridiales bacterium]
MKKKESKWKKKRNKKLYPKKNNYIIFVIVLFIIGSAFAFRYMMDVFEGEDKAVSITDIQNRQAVFELPQKKPLLPINFDEIESN